MEFQRIILVTALFLTLYLIWNQWQIEHSSQYLNPELVNQVDGIPTATSKTNSVSPSVAPGIEVPESADRVGRKEGGHALSSAPSEMDRSGENLHIQTDLLDVVINTAGGNILQVDLLAHGKDSDHPEIPFRLMMDQYPRFVAQTGIKGARNTNAQDYPDHQVRFVTEQKEFLLAEGEQELRIPLVWADAPQGLRVTKTYVFHRDSYKVDVEYQIENRTDSTWKGGVYGQLLRNNVERGSEQFFLYTYTGGAYYTTEEKFQKIDFDEIGDGELNRPTEKGWVAMLQHYFLGAVVPDQQKSPTLYSYSPAMGEYAIGAMLPAVTVAAGETNTLSMQLFVGPKDQARLTKIAEGLDLSVDYGWLTFLSKPLFWVLQQIQTVVVNWGVAIILLTLLIKIAFYWLSAKSYRSMARMKKLQPRLTSLKEKFGSDRQKMSEAMMKIYREEKVNPMGGCLPILVQIPVFIALYWVLLESVEMRQATFLWIGDLSEKDPLFILPLVMGGSMLIQYKLNPAPMDPMQQKVMMALPVIFTVFFAFFPAGLVLYWTVNNVLSIAQQWYITRNME